MTKLSKRVIISHSHHYDHFGVQMKSFKLKERMERFIYMDPQDAPIPIEPQIFIHYVRTGEYVFPYRGPLSGTGRSQAAHAAEIIRAHVSGFPVAVFGNLPFATYEETAQIIATNLGVETILSDVTLAPSILNISFFREQMRQGVYHFVHVINGTYLGKILQEFDGPTVELEELGPAHGSVHTLCVDLDMRLSGRVVGQKFI